MGTQEAPLLLLHSLEEKGAPNLNDPLFTSFPWDTTGIVVIKQQETHFLSYLNRASRGEVIFKGPFRTGQ